ncbi:MAG TPA: DnaJ domain-containing protein [Candidatus Limnocylindrales bacterium]|nr:DnaJ domain-containing protein [Candidatus Limnocylindrales bacterium]
MAADPDPYRTLGLPRDATTEEIRRAYRRLAKANHPDSAGEAALPRFLAIQAAYEALIGPAPDGLGRGPAGASRAGGEPWRGGGEPWRADPDRARSTREAWERRAGRRPGARPGTSPEPEAGGGGTTRRRAASAGPSPGEARTGSGASPGRRGQRRAANKATLGSTTYDAAEDEPFEPEWSGGTWYGSSSGTYWTINPKEYADPRKHGPEYQRRARRRLDGSPGIEAEAEEDVGRRLDDEPDGPGPGSRDEAPTGPEAPGGARTADPATETWTAPAGGRSGPGSPTGAAPRPPHAPASAASSWLGSLAWPGGFAGRVALALLAWPPIGLALATAAGEMTGCSRFAAGCVELFGVGTWLGQLVILSVLLALPTLAAVAAVGTLAALAASVPTAVFLSATGGSRQPDAAGAILAAVLGIAWLAGAAFAVVRRVRLRRVP